MHHILIKGALALKKCNDMNLELSDNDCIQISNEKIICPECGLIQYAKVEHTIPFSTYIHECEKCEYIIMESEWQRDEELKYPIEQLAKERIEQ